MPEKTLSLLNQPKRERLPDQVADQIKQLILSRQIKINEKIPSERTLAAALDVSSNVIRSALQSLEQAGYVEIRHGRHGGSFVTDNLFKPFLDSIYDLFQRGDLTLQHFFETRCQVERQSVARAASAVTARDIQRLQKINAVLKKPMDKTGFAKNNLAFHEMIAEIGGNPLVKLMVTALLNMMNLMYPGNLQTQDFIDNTSNRHAQIIAALEKRDPASAEELIVKDIEFNQGLRIAPVPKFRDTF